MKKALLPTTAFVVLVMVSFAFTQAEDPKYKNLKVLPKNTTKKQMDSVMHHFTASLNVKCNFCHQYNQEQKSMDFASDANEHKGVARDMMRMTNKMNKKYFDVNSKSLDAKLEVTCFTCHHGKSEPSSWPPPPPPRQ